MLAFRSTKRLATKLKVKLDKMAPASTGQLGDWFANLVEIPVPIVVCVNGPTRLTLVIPALDADEVLFQFRMRLEHLLLELGIDAAVVAREIAATTPVVFAPTNDRKVMGSLNDICSQVSWWLEDQGPMFTESELFKQEVQLAGCPHSNLKETFPDRAVRARLQPESGAGVMTRQ